MDVSNLSIDAQVWQPHQLGWEWRNSDPEADERFDGAYTSKCIQCVLFIRVLYVSCCIVVIVCFLSKLHSVLASSSKPKHRDHGKNSWDRNHNLLRSASTFVRWKSNRLHLMSWSCSCYQAVCLGSEGTVGGQALIKHSYLSRSVLNRSTSFRR